MQNLRDEITHSMEYRLRVKCNALYYYVKFLVYKNQCQNNNPTYYTFGVDIILHET